MTNIEGIGSRIRASREKAGLQISELADAAHIKWKVLERYEAGGVEPELDAIAGIAHATDVDLAWLAFGVGEPGDGAERPKHALVSVPAVSFFDGRVYETVSSHAFSREFVVRTLRIDSTVGLVAMEVETDGFVAFKPGTHILVDTAQQEITSDGFYLLWSNLSAQIVRVTSVPGDFGTVSVLTRQKADPTVIVAEHLFVLGRIKGKLAASR